MTKQVKITIEQIAQLKRKGVSQKDMASIFQVTPQTIIRWKNPNTVPPQKRGCKPKAAENDFKLLKSYVSKNNTNTQQKMANYLSKKTRKSISQQTVSRILKKEGISYKKLTYHYIQLDEEKAKKFNEEIKSLLNEFPFIALDECSFYPSLNPRFGYSSRGQRSIEVRFITPYAPMINPAELCFNFLRQRTERSRSRNYEGMKSAIEKAIKLLNKKNLLKWFWHCAEYFDKNTYNGKSRNKKQNNLLPKKGRSTK